MATDRYELEMKVVMGYVRESQDQLKLSSRVPREITQLCHTFYHVIYKWDKLTKANEKLELNDECDIVILHQSNWQVHNIFGDGVLNTNEIHKIDFKIHECVNIHLGILPSNAVDQYIGASTSWHNVYYSYFSDGRRGDFHIDGLTRQSPKPPAYKSGDTLSMIVDLESGKLDYEINGKSSGLNIDIPKNKQYRIALMTFGQPNKVQIK